MVIDPPKSSRGCEARFSEDRAESEASRPKSEAMKAKVIQEHRRTSSTSRYRKSFIFSIGASLAGMYGGFVPVTHGLRNCVLVLRELRVIS